MQTDMKVCLLNHLQNGNVWQVEVELAMQGGESDEQLYYTVSVDIVAPNRDLAQYIVSTMYPDYTSISVADEPVHS
tara:strand:+ start:54 stop:281 length:228 start_codon:yes stop_codon:yes gene_type:complete